MYWRLLCVTLTGLSVARALTGESVIVVSVHGSVSLRTGELCYGYYRRLVSMFTCRVAVSEGKQVEIVSDEGRDHSLRTTYIIPLYKFTPDCFRTVKSENVQFVTIRSWFHLIFKILI